MAVTGVVTALTLTGQQPLVWQPMGRAGGGSASGYHANYSADFSHSFEDDLTRGGVRAGDFSASLLRLGYTAIFPLGGNYSWGVGAQWDYAAFDAPATVPVPDEIHALGLRVVSNWRFREAWTLRSEFRPGLQTDFEDVDGGDFNVPFTIALGYDATPELQWVLAVNVDFRREFPVVGGPGVIWRFAEDWRLLLLLPRPQLEFSPTDRLTLFVGGELRAPTARVAEDFGSPYGDVRLNDDQLTYREFRAGAGARLSVSRNLQVALEAGYAFGRQFHFDRADLRLRGGDAPYIQLGLTGSY